MDDPRDSFVGIDELEAAVKRLRSSKPEYVFTIASEIDHHHDRLRYRWDMARNGRTLMEGLDMATVDPSSGLITRVHGFFGHPTPVHVDASGVPKRSDPSQPTKQLRRPRRSHIARPRSAGAERLLPAVSGPRTAGPSGAWLRVAWSRPLDLADEGIVGLPIESGLLEWVQLEQRMSQRRRARRGGDPVVR